MPLSVSRERSGARIKMLHNVVLRLLVLIPITSSLAFLISFLLGVGYEPCTVLKPVCNEAPDERYDETFKNALHSQAAVDWVKANLHPPSDQPYAIPKYRAGVPRPSLPNGMIDYSQFRQSELVISKYFNHKRNGRFLEIGAFNGYTFSNTLLLERYYNWTGLLIEPSKKHFETLLTLNRKAYALNACVGYTFDVQHGQFDSFDLKAGDAVGCTTVPMSAVMEAMGWTHWDYWSIDVDGGEAALLMSIPWHTVTADLIQIECNRCDNKTIMSNKLEDRGMKVERSERYFLQEIMPVVGYKEVDFYALDFYYQPVRSRH